MAAERPCAIVNAAAVGLVDEAERNPERALALNRDGAARLAAAAAHSGIPFLHISTDFVFDGSKRTPYVEEDPASPANIYGRSKLAGEQAVLAAHPPALVLRTGGLWPARRELPHHHAAPGRDAGRRARGGGSIRQPDRRRRSGAGAPRHRGAGTACRASSRFRWPSGQARRNVAARSSVFSASGCRPGRSRWIVASTPSTEQGPRSRNGSADGRSGGR
jgi:nucleoside-diphosphate-sugar epimerase